MHVQTNIKQLIFQNLILVLY